MPQEWSTLRFERPLLIAEIGGNHEGSMDRAHALARQAVDAGADVVKFQTYWADSLVNQRLAPERHAHFRRFELPIEAWFELAAAVEAMGAVWMTSLWDPDLVEAFDPITTAWKLGSGDLTNLQMIERVLATGKPVILSTAMADHDEVVEILDLVRAREPELVAAGGLGLLQCTAMYDDPDGANAHLAVMDTFRQALPDVVVGYSDHALGVETAKMAAAAGAGILEVHFTDDTTRSFRDHRLSALPAQLRELRDWLDALVLARGDGRKQVRPEEVENRSTFRRAIYPARDLAAGSVLGPDDLVVLRPNTGLDARRWPQVLGRRLRRDVGALEPLAEDDVEW